MKKPHFNRRFSDKVEREIARLYQLDVQHGSVFLAKKFSCTYGCIINALKRQGVRIRTFKESQTRLRIGNNHPNYKGGNLHRGYRRIYVERDGRRKCVLEHRYLLEESIGRRLNSNEVAHHINGDKLDNRLENLKLLTRAEHCAEHNSLGLFK